MRHSNLRWTLVLEPHPSAPSFEGFMFTPILREGSSTFKEDLNTTIKERRKLIQIILFDEERASQFEDLDEGFVQILPMNGHTIESMFDRVEIGLLSNSQAVTRCIKVIDAQGLPLYIYGYKDKAIISRNPKYSRK